MVGPAALRSTATQPGSYGSWGAVWRSLRGWLPTLRGASLVGSGEGAQLEFRSSLALAFDRVTASLDAVRAHAHVALLPRDAKARLGAAAELPQTEVRTKRTCADRKAAAK